ncbi:MetQ/NlpA family ABC transporter substrate-binding protein [Pantoea agglomerans]|uniref:MetQ/NlpA family ABC transporter substrate-binding protein n=1 Tax=Enterobacter agglomerans TaxID=549 RepID=UPI0013BB2B7E|nr:MetQ/NlpA family ABC transporter substrate-binding protein [Pantoea agglomerans]NEG60445.1 methionine-binding protein [Pantoea agglomerans]NEH01275.1 methionine-binding protein [Pantoea agglomerans]NEH05672.1 methionine-binding protein [Pantoea agglomerans]NEH16704.1 methionine-binding protein [Pantoea agglomerans]
MQITSRGIILALTTASLFISAAQAADQKKIRIGFNPGPYKEQFEKGVAPLLIRQGYTLEYKDFSDGIQVNDAVHRGTIDANIMQHPVYLKSVNDRLGIDNVGIVQVPTPPMGLYSERVKTLTQPAPGSTVSVPNQPSNEYRAALLLQSIGWLKISPDSDAATFSQKNITENPYKIVLKEMDNAQQVRALPDVDYGVIQGNFAVSSGMKLNSALKLEAATSQFINVVTVAGKNKQAQFARDIIAGYHSAEFKSYIAGNAQYAGYLLPDYFK